MQPYAPPTVVLTLLKAPRDFGTSLPALSACEVGGCNSKRLRTTVIVNSAFPFKALALMGCERALVFNPSFLAKPQSIKLSSAPESIKMSFSVTVVLCVTLMGVKLHEAEPEVMNWLTIRAALAGKMATRCPGSLQ